MSSMKILVSASLAAVCRTGKSRSLRKPSRDGVDAGAKRKPLHGCWRSFPARTRRRPFVLYGDVLDMFMASAVLPMEARGDHDHFRAVQAVGHFVEVREASREAGDGAAAGVEFSIAPMAATTICFMFAARP